MVHFRHSFTKELDGDTGLVFMHQRWYLPEVGVFVSRAPYPPMVEHPYVFAISDPAGIYDSDGEMPQALIGCLAGAGLSIGFNIAKRYLVRDEPYKSKCHAIVENMCIGAIGCMVGALASTGGVGALTLFRKAVEQAAQQATSKALASTLGILGGMGVGMLCKAPCKAAADSVCSTMHGYTRDIQRNDEKIEEALEEGAE